MPLGRKRSRRASAGRYQRRLPSRWVPAATLALVLAGCSTTAGHPRVVVVGDSITALAQPDISTALDPSSDVGYVFRISVRIDQLLGLVASDQRDNGPTTAVIINLGTNDAIAGGASDHALASFGRLLTEVGSVPCVVLTTVGPFADQRGHGDVGASLNRRIMDLVAADPRRYKLVDWNGFLNTLDSQTRPDYLQPDLIHETPA